MARQLSENEEFAGGLTSLVVQQCAAFNSSSIPLFALLSTAPIKEVTYTRLGLNALVELGALSSTGDEFAVTETGRAFLVYVQTAKAGAPPLNLDTNDSSVLFTLLDGIESEHRLTPPDAKDMRTLPSRLDELEEEGWLRFINPYTALAAIALATGGAYLAFCR